jgi:uncharacterized membrane-anchored protein YhcB (DUF1043 family)
LEGWEGVMDWGVVVAALVTAVGGIVTTLLMRFRKENRDDHATVMATIDRIGGKLDQLDSKLGDHIDWHFKEATNGKVSRRNTNSRKSKAKPAQANTRRTA